MMVESYLQTKYIPEPSTMVLGGVMLLVGRRHKAT